MQNLNSILTLSVVLATVAAASLSSAEAQSSGLKSRS
jgi:hypothetical protein